MKKYTLFVLGLVFNFFLTTNLNQAHADNNEVRRVFNLLTELKKADYSELEKTNEILRKLRVRKYHESFHVIANTLFDSYDVDVEKGKIDYNTITDKLQFQVRLLNELVIYDHQDGYEIIATLRDSFYEYSDYIANLFKQIPQPVNKLLVMEEGILSGLIKKYYDSAIQAYPKIFKDPKSNNKKSTALATTKNNATATNSDSAAEKTIWDDPEMFKKLSGLEDELNKHIFDQEESNKKVVNAIKGYQVFHKASKAPVKIMLIGSTGTGKTETAKIINNFLFPGQNLGLFDMGKVIIDGEMSDIFGSTRPYVGSDKMAQFEEFLSKNDKGVIVFDEISNMGGKDAQQKAALFRKGFYSLMEEGVWTSPLTTNQEPKKYNLKNYIIIFTGNDAEQLFRDLLDDSIKEQTWKEYKAGSKVRELLRQSNVPEAFVGRLTEVILQKPMMKNSGTKISEKIISIRAQILKDTGINVEFSDDFFAVFGENFLSSAEGARSIIHAVESKLGSAIHPIIERAGGIENLKDKTIHLSIKSIKGKKPYARASDPETNLTINVELKDSTGYVVDKSNLDLTEMLDIKQLPSLRVALSTAYHEAGHAVLNNEKVTGTKVSLITIFGSGGASGYNIFDDANKNIADYFTDEKFFVRKVAQLIAGQRAEQLSGTYANSGWSSDLQKVRSYIQLYVVELGLGKGTERIQVDKEGEPIVTGEMSEIVEAEVNRLWDAAEALCRDELLKNWPLIRRMVGDLLKNGTITEAGVKEHLKWFKQTKPTPWYYNPETGKAVRTPIESAHGLRCERIFLVR